MTIHLTRDDTYTMYLDASPFLGLWADLREERLARNTGEEVTDWAVTVTEKDSDRSVLLDHDVMVATLRRVVADGNPFGLRGRFVTMVAAIVDAPDNVTASDAVVQLDPPKIDTLVQLATLGTERYY
jgi:hypothetical protein